MVPFISTKQAAWNGVLLVITAAFSMPAGGRLHVIEQASFVIILVGIIHLIVLGAWHGARGTSWVPEGDEKYVMCIVYQYALFVLGIETIALGTSGLGIGVVCLIFAAGSCCSEASLNQFGLPRKVGPRLVDSFFALTCVMAAFTAYAFSGEYLVHMLERPLLDAWRIGIPLALWVAQIMWAFSLDYRQQLAQAASAPNETSVTQLRA